MAARVALIDSGVHATHPHLRGMGEVLLGPVFAGEGGVADREGQRDVLGHGTAAAAAILDLAPGSTLLSIQVFEGEPRCPFARVIAALRHALDWGPAIVNLSLGTTEAVWRGELLAIGREARARGIRIVSPAVGGGLPSLPGVLEGFEGVLMDARLARDAPERRASGARVFWYASPYPRDLPGLPRAANLSGPSLAAANVSGCLASGRFDEEPLVQELHEPPLDCGGA